MARWVDDITQALINLGGSAHRKEILEEVKRIRSEPPPKSIIRIIQRTIQDHSSDSEGFNKANLEKDLFFSVRGIGEGYWGLRNFKPDLASDVKDVDASRRIKTTISRIIRNTTLSSHVKNLHKNQCQICGLALHRGKEETYSEAHHIKPLGTPHDGPDILENLIVLCPNHHAQLDFGAIPIDFLQLRTVENHSIGNEYIDYHNQCIYKE